MAGGTVQRGRHSRSKRLLDVGVAFPALLLASPVLLTTALFILALDGRPVLFRQMRPGLDGRPFHIVKFRTMRPPHPGEDRYRSDADRVSRLGRLLRASSLDELPELWNVVRGEMSLVGPRPLLMEYLPAYTPHQARRHEVRPGITSWAIVQGRHSLSFNERLELDVWYVDHQSIRLDLAILGRTLAHLIRRRHAVATQDIDNVGFPLPPAGGASNPSS